MSFALLQDALVRSELARAVERRGIKGDAAERAVSHFAPAIRATNEGRIEIPGHTDLDDLLSVRANELAQFATAATPQAMPPLSPLATPEQKFAWANEAKRREVEAAKAVRAGLSS